MSTSARQQERFDGIVTASRVAAGKASTSVRALGEGALDLSSGLARKTAAFSQASGRRQEEVRWREAVGDGGQYVGGCW